MKYKYSKMIIKFKCFNFNYFNYLNKENVILLLKLLVVQC